MIAVSSSDHGAPWELQLAKIQAKIKTCFKNDMIPIEAETLSITLFCTLTSMTSLLMHTVAHSTRHSFRPKTNNQPLKKVFKSCGQLSQSRQKLDVILENKVV